MRFTLVRLYAKDLENQTVTYANIAFEEELNLEEAMEQAYMHVRDECDAPFTIHDVLILDDKQEGTIVKCLFDEKDLQ